MGLTGTWEQAKDGKGGSTGRGKAVKGSCEELLETPGMGGKRRRALEAGGRGAVHVDGRSAPGQDGGGGASRCKERENRR